MWVDIRVMPQSTLFYGFGFSLPSEDQWRPSEYQIWGVCTHFGLVLIYRRTDYLAVVFNAYVCPLFACTSIGSWAFHQKTNGGLKSKLGISSNFGQVFTFRMTDHPMPDIYYTYICPLLACICFVNSAF